MNPPPFPPSPPATQSGLATASMVCGILAVPTCYATLLPAIIMGHIAWSKGDKPSRAKLGLIFGYGSLALVPVIAAIAGLTAPLVIRQRHKANQVECMNHVRQVGMALYEYQEEHGEFPPDLGKLESEGILTNLDELLGIHSANDGEWLYFPKANPELPSALLLVSPPIDRKNVVLRVDQSVRLEPTDTQSGNTSEEVNHPPVRIPVPLRSAN